MTRLRPRAPGRAARRALAWVAALGVACLPATGSAQPRRLEPGAPSAAEARYQIGIDLYRDGAFARAADEFEAGLAIFPTSAKLAYNLARALERADRVEPAIEAYRRYLRLAPGAEDAGEVSRLIALLEARRDADRPRVVAESSPRGALIYVDGGSEAAGRTPAELRLAPGPHELRFVLPGRLTASRRVEPVVGQTVHVTVTLPRSGDAALADEAEGGGTDWRPVAGWTATGLGLAGLAVGAVFLGEAQGAADDAAGTRGDTYRARREDFERAEALYIGGFVGGGVLLATGVTLLLWPSDDVEVSVGPGGSAVIQGRF